MTTRPTLFIGIAAAALACGGGTASQSATSTSAAPSASASAPVAGRLPPEVIQRIVHENAAGFQQCYEDAAKNSPNIHGRTSTRILIDRTGHVSISSDLGSEGTLPAEVGKCVAEHFEKLVFPAPEGGTLTVVYPLIFGKSEASAGGDLSAPTSNVPFDKGAAAKAMLDAEKQSATCSKPGGPTGAGHIKVTFDITGHVTSTDLDSGPFAGTAVGVCIQARFHEAHIAPFSGGPVTVGKAFTIR